jgi:hypothetical protein
VTDDSAPAPTARRRRVATGIAIVMVLALVALWLVRKPIAEHFIDRALAGSGVPVRYGIADLGFGRQRLVDVVIGSPDAPDLVADWIETETVIGLSGATLSGVRAGRLRVRGRLVDGRVSLGAIDRLLPASSGKPFALPALALDVEDGRMRLETPWGVAGIALTGRGRLDRGFVGRIAVVSASLALPGCRADQVAAALQVRTARGGVVRLDGPVRSDRIECASVRTGAVRSGLMARIVTADRLGWSLQSRLAVAGLRHGGLVAASLAGTATLGDTSGGATGRVALVARDLRGFGVRAGRAGVDGRVDIAARTPRFRGTVALGEANASALVPVSQPTLGAGTPLAPLEQRFVRGVERAATRFDATATVDAAPDRVAVGGMTLTSSSGARVTLASGSALAWNPEEGATIDGTVRVAGGDLPTIAARVRGRAGVIAGTATIASYKAESARLALAPIVFSAGRGSSHVATTATLSGPLGDGRVDALTVPIDARWARGRLTINPGCAPVAWQRVAASGLVIDPGRLDLCPLGAALVVVHDGGVSGGARFGGVRLAGRLGATPLAIAAAGAEVRLADRGFVLHGVGARLGPPTRLTRADADTVSGTLGRNGALAGQFAGAAGQIANVPLLLGGAAGKWTYSAGTLALGGAMTVTDSAGSPRFQPLAARAVALRLADGRIAASATLYEPTRDVAVAEVAITHVLSSGRGGARITVSGISFDEAFQPELLTRLTFGVIAEVRGTITGSGAIAWSPAGVTSTGDFATAGTDLAAAFGTVTGLRGSIHFTDLLALESAPAQVATVATINPGIPVTDGRITYQTYRGSRVLVNGARWPFAGGTLTLDPTLLDFSAPQARRLTFRIDGAAADQFLQQFEFKNLDATGTFDGVLPMIFDERGGRIEGGRLTVRAGGGSLAYVGELTQKDLGIWGNLAFQALKSLRYRDLGIVMNGPLAGEMITEVRFAGISQGAGAKSNFLVRKLQRLPFVFNIRIKAPFRGLIDSAASFYDPRRLIERNLPQLLERQNRGDPQPPPIQPTESETLP